MASPTNFLGKSPAGVAGTANPGTAIYTAPSTANGWVEARILVTNITSAAVALTCWIGVPAVTAANIISWSGGSIPAYSSDEVRLFLAPSEALYLMAGAAASINYRVSLAEIS